MLHLFDEGAEIECNTYSLGVGHRDVEREIRGFGNSGSHHPSRSIHSFLITIYPPLHLSSEKPKRMPLFRTVTGNEVAYGEPAEEMGVQQRIIEVLHSQVCLPACERYSTRAGGAREPFTAFDRCRLYRSYRDGQPISNEIGWILRLPSDHLSFVRLSLPSRVWFLS